MGKAEGAFAMSSKAHFILRDQSGVALVIALVMIVILTLIGLASTYTSTFEIKLSGNKRGTTDAFYAADSGVQVTVANIDNFSLPGRYVDNKYDPFTDPSNPNPTKSKVVITHDTTQSGSPRGIQMSATNFGFEHYRVESTGNDQTALSPIKSTCTVEQKIVRLVPTLQGGY
jgi:type IV pilus assembly protein PilX